MTHINNDHDGALGQRNWLKWVQRADWRSALVLIALAVQCVYLGKNYIVPEIRKISSVWGETAIERSAQLMLGSEAADLIRFIREVVPPDPEVTVVLPYRGQRGPFTSIALMQYFFYPREVDNCSDPLEVCLGYVTGETKYVIGGPLEEGVEIGNKIYMPLNEKSGIYVPNVHKE
jgi:hypothetical protein